MHWFAPEGYGTEGRDERREMDLGNRHFSSPHETLLSATEKGDRTAGASKPALEELPDVLRT